MCCMAIDLEKAKKFIRINTDDDDTLVQSLINAANSVVRSILGLGKTDDLPDNARVDLAINYLTLFYYENRSFVKAENSKALIRVVSSLLDQDKDHASFMPEIEDTT